MEKLLLKLRFLWLFLLIPALGLSQGVVSGNITDASYGGPLAGVNVVIKAASISTGFIPLDDHLKSADFFEVRKYPQIVFRSTKIVQLGTQTGQIIGDLTIRDKTRTITLDVRLNRYYEVHPLANLGARYAGAPYAGFSARAQVLRTDFGVGLYAPGTSNKVDIVIETELRRKH